MVPEVLAVLDAGCVFVKTVSSLCALRGRPGVLPWGSRSLRKQDCWTADLAVLVAPGRLPELRLHETLAVSPVQQHTAACKMRWAAILPEPFS